MESNNSTRLSFKLENITYKSKLNCMKFNIDNGLLATGDEQGKICIWDNLISKPIKLMGNSNTPSDIM